MCRALSIFAASNLVMGTTLALVAATPAAAPAIRLFLWALPDQDPLTADQPMLRWILGIAGGVWAGWGATLWAQARGAGPVPALMQGLVLWCALDSLASAVNGASLNVAINLSWVALGALAARRAG
jgi:hypothetical protein